MSKKKICILIVLPKENKDLKGHIIMQLTADLLAFKLYKVNFSLYTTRSVLKSLSHELNSLGYDCSFIRKNSNISGKNFTNTIKAIDKWLKSDFKNNRELRVYFPWWDLIPLKELKTCEKLFLRNSIKWSTISHVSTHLRRNSKNRESEFLEYASTSKNVHKIFYWDSLSEKSFESKYQSLVKKLPEYHFYIRKKKIKKESNKLVVGFLGLQSVQRGKLLFLWLACLNPNVTFFGVGTPSGSSDYFPKIKRIPVIGKTLNIKLSQSVYSLQVFIRNHYELNKYFKNQTEFNNYMITFDAIFSAGHLIPYSSGVALQSLACGVPVIWTKGNSAHSDQMQVHFPYGKLKVTDKLLPFRLGSKIKKLNKNNSPVPVVKFREYARIFVKNFIN